MKFARATVWLAVAALGAGGCASLRSAARPVSSVDDRLSAVRNLPESRIYAAFYRPGDQCTGDAKWPDCRDGLTPRGYRDVIAALYLSAADARYEEFRDSLSMEAKGTAFGGNLLTLLMSGLATVSGAEGARALAAGSAVVQGGQASVSRDLFMQRALPAVLASMNASRTTAKAGIVANLQLDAGAYSLPSAISDIRRLEGAAQLEAGLQSLATTADAQTAVAEKTLEIAYVAPLRGPELTAKIGAMLNAFDTFDQTRLDAIAAALGVASADKATQSANIRRRIGEESSTQSRYDALVITLKPATGQDAY